MKKKFKVTLVVFLVVVLGCFSNIFAATSQNNKAKKIIEVKKSIKLLDNAAANNSSMGNEEVDQYTKLLMHMDDNNFKDECGHTSTNNNVTLDTNNKKFGNGSASLDGLSMKYFSIADSDDWNFENNDFTIDFWLYLNSLQNKYLQLYSQRTDDRAVSPVEILVNPNNKLEFFLSFDNVSWAVDEASSAPLSTKVWQHIALVRHGAMYTLYLDGKPIATKTISGTFKNSTSPLNIGGVGVNYGGTSYLDGYLDEYRISNGIARWTSSFTPPTNPYNNVLATGITLNKTTDSLPVGETDNLTATLTPDNTSNKTVKWVSSDPTIVSVDQNTGVITALKAGTATITATTTDGSNLSASCVVTVTDPVISPVVIGNRATLTINMVNGSTKQYDLSEDELNSFLSWYNGMTNPLSSQCYVFNNPIIGPYLNNKDYIPFNKIDDFKIQEYTK